MQSATESQSHDVLCVFDSSGVLCVRCGYTAPVPNVIRNCVLPNEPPALPLSHGPGTEQMPTRSAPGFLDKLRNFAAAAAGHVAAGMPMASDEEIIRRHDICLACEHLVDDACTQCGCPVARVRGYVSKLSWADSECPVGKWGKSDG